MRPPAPQKTNLTSLAAIASVLAFVIWVTAFETQQGSILARAPQTSAASGALAIGRG